MDIETELRVIAAIRYLAHALGMPGGGMDRIDELLDEMRASRSGNDLQHDTRRPQPG